MNEELLKYILGETLYEFHVEMRDRVDMNNPDIYALYNRTVEAEYPKIRERLQKISDDFPAISDVVPGGATHLTTRTRQFINTVYRDQKGQKLYDYMEQYVNKANAAYDVIQGADKSFEIKNGELTYIPLNSSPEVKLVKQNDYRLKRANYVRNYISDKDLGILSSIPSPADDVRAYQAVMMNKILPQIKDEGDRNALKEQLKGITLPGVAFGRGDDVVGPALKKLETINQSAKVVTKAEAAPDPTEKEVEALTESKSQAQPTTTQTATTQVVSATTTTASSAAPAKPTTKDYSLTVDGKKATEDEAKWIQKQLGFTGDDVDGLVGPKTTAALKGKVLKRNENGDLTLDGKSYSGVGEPIDKEGATATPASDGAAPASAPPTTPTTTPPSNATPTQTTDVDTSFEDNLREVLEAKKRGDKIGMATNLGKVIRGLAGLGMSAKELDRDMPEYKPTKYLFEAIEKADRLAATGIPEVEENQMKGEARMALERDLAFVKRYAGGSTGAVLGNRYQAIRNYWKGLSGIEAADIEARIKATPLAMNAREAMENRYFEIYNQNREMELAAKNAAAELMSSSLTNINNAEQFQQFYGPGSLNDVINWANAQNALNTEVDTNDAKAQMAGNLLDPTTSGFSPDAYGVTSQKNQLRPGYNPQSQTQNEQVLAP